MAIFETIEPRRLFSGVLYPGTVLDPIVGPIGPNPGSIGLPLDPIRIVPLGSLLVPVLPRHGGGGNSVMPVIGQTGGTSGIGLTGGTAGVGTTGGTGGAGITGGTDGPITAFDQANFLQRGFPFLFSSGASMKVASGTLNISGTNGNDVILITRPATANGSILSSAPLDVTVNFQRVEFDQNTFGRFVFRIYVSGGDGDDVLSASADLNIPVDFNGGPGNDSLAGGAHNDTLNGGSGNDILIGGDGNDLLLGGNGNDSLDGGAGNDTLLGNKGNDLIRNASPTSPISPTDADYVDGGPGKDSAGVDILDQILGIE